MAFIPYSSDDKSQVALTVDKFGRICLSAGLRRKLGCENDDEIQLFLFFEPETRRIGLTKEYPGRYKPFKFDGRGYVAAKDFLNDNDVEYASGSVRYMYDGSYNGIMAFKASGAYMDPVKTTFKQERNGNLERVGGSL